MEKWGRELETTTHGTTKLGMREKEEKRKVRTQLHVGGGKWSGPVGNIWLVLTVSRRPLFTVETRH